MSARWSARLDAITAPVPEPQHYASVAGLLERVAVDDADAFMLRQMLGFAPTPQRVNRKRNPVKHGTPEGLRWHAEHAVPDCQPCGRYRYAHDVHGTEQACQAHYRDGTQLCAECAAFYDRVHKRAKEISGISCNSPAGYRRHIRLGERVCESCRGAESRRETKRNGVGELAAVGGA